MSNTIPLTKPIQAHGEELQALTLREPTVEDNMDLGSPFLIHSNGGESAIEIRLKVVGQYVSRLAGVPLSSVKAMALTDFAQAQAVVLGFFGKGPDAADPS